MKQRLYVAYGSNLNKSQMKFRCPTAKLYGVGTIEGYELQFKGSSNSAFATIAPKEGASVPVAVWSLKPMDEFMLDRYEGYPSHYFKQDIPVNINGKEITAMAYIMNLKMDFGLPSNSYYHIVRQGYDDCGLDTAVLEKAVLDSAKQFYSKETNYRHHLLIDDGDEDEELTGDEDEDIDEDEEFDDEDIVEDDIDEDDAFYSHDGMKFQ